MHPVGGKIVVKVTTAPIVHSLNTDRIFIHVFLTHRLHFTEATHIMRVRSGGHAARIPVAFEIVNDRRSESQPDAHRDDALSPRVRAVINSS